jgi:hypothetical protein
MERLSRRNILGAASVIARGFFLPVEPGATTLLADPVATLGEVRRAAHMRAEALASALDNRSNDGTPEYRAASFAVGAAWDAVQEVEDRMAAMVAIGRRTFVILAGHDPARRSSPSSVTARS